MNFTYTYFSCLVLICFKLLLCVQLHIVCFGLLLSYIRSVFFIFLLNNYSIRKCNYVLQFKIYKKYEVAKFKMINEVNIQLNSSYTVAVIPSFAENQTSLNIVRKIYSLAFFKNAVKLLQRCRKNAEIV